MNYNDTNPSFDLYNDESDINAFAAALATDDLATAEKLLEWAQRVQVQYAIIQNALMGQMTIGLQDDGEPIFTMTEEGKKRVEELIKPHWPEIINIEPVED